MKLTQTSLILATLLVACLAGTALAQVGSRARRLYDPNTETTVKGTVEKVTEIGRQGGPVPILPYERMSRRTTYMSVRQRMLQRVD
ncbi:MAG TPA: hypothetical protein VMV57_11620, partial [Terracidiphilus sp.]|nr:hypothetical protein [Terracidiphilus sp.]